MRTSAAIKHFGSPAKLAEALGITVQAIYQWGETVPKGREFEIHVLTDGALKARPTDKRKTAA